MIFEVYHAMALFQLFYTSRLDASRYWPSQSKVCLVKDV